MLTLEKTHPTAATLIPSGAVRTVAGARQFLVDHQIVDIPSTTMPIVTESAALCPHRGRMRRWTPPGPFETKATEAFYYVTPPEERIGMPEHTWKSTCASSTRRS